MRMLAHLSGLPADRVELKSFLRVPDGDQHLDIDPPRPFGDILRPPKQKFLAPVLGLGFRLEDAGADDAAAEPGDPIEEEAILGLDGRRLLPAGEVNALGQPWRGGEATDSDVLFRQPFAIQRRASGTYCLNP